MITLLEQRISHIDHKVKPTAIGKLGLRGKDHAQALAYAPHQDDGSTSSGRLWTVAWQLSRNQRSERQRLYVGKCADIDPLEVKSPLLEVLMLCRSPLKPLSEICSVDNAQRAV